MALSLCVRTDSGPVALQAFWGMHVEAMNFSGLGHAEYAAALGLSPHALRIGRDRSNNPATKRTVEACFIRVPRRN